MLIQCDDLKATGWGLDQEGVAREPFYWMALVDLMFFCSPWRWPFLVAVEFLRCFDMGEAVRPGQVVKWLRFMAWRKVDGMGIKTVPWRNVARLSFV